MFCDWVWIGVMGISCIRNPYNSEQSNDCILKGEHLDVPSWLKNATSGYIRPIMSEQSLLMRLYDERASNDVEDSNSSHKNHTETLARQIIEAMCLNE